MHPQHLPLHPVIPKSYEFYPIPLCGTVIPSLLFLLAFVKAPDAQWGSWDSPALPYNIERLQIPVRSSQDHTGLTRIYRLYLMYHLYLSGHDGGQPPVDDKSPGFWGRQTRTKTLVLPPLHSSCFSPSFIRMDSPLCSLSRVCEQNHPNSSPPQDTSGSFKDPSGELAL